MNKFAFGAALAALAAAIPTVASAQRAPGAVIVTVDKDRIYRECNACKTAQQQLQGQLTSLQQRAQQLGQPIQTEGQSIETAVRALNGKSPDPALQQRIQALQTKQNTANQEIQNREQQLRSTQAHVLQQIDERMGPVIQQVMNARGANLAVDEGATLAHAAALDVTNDVLAALNQALPSVSITPMPATGAQQQQPGR